MVRLDRTIALPSHRVENNPPVKPEDDSEGSRRQTVEGPEANSGGAGGKQWRGRRKTVEEPEANSGGAGGKQWRSRRMTIEGAGG
jgi:hypothetical protein